VAGGTCIDGLICSAARPRCVGGLAISATDRPTAACHGLRRPARRADTTVAAVHLELSAVRCSSGGLIPAVRVDLEIGSAIGEQLRRLGGQTLEIASAAFASNTTVLSGRHAAVMSAGIVSGVNNSGGTVISGGGTMSAAA